MSILVRPDSSRFSLDEVEALYRREKNPRLARKLNAIRLLMMGESQQDTAKAVGVSVATVRGWTKAWNATGKERLLDPFKGCNSQVTPEFRAEIEGVIEIKREINGRVITGRLIHGYLKKNEAVSSRGQCFSSTQRGFGV